jgi:hypothetical protein
MQLAILSRRPDAFGRPMQHYMLDGISTIGVYGDEPFAIRFRNSASHKVQIKLSLDGTDLLTGQIANLDPQSRMWVVSPYGTTELTAWPESAHGGAAFIFSSVEKSVAAHTHGDMTAKGFISCAVFVEGHVPPIKLFEGPVVTRGEPAIGAGSYQEQHIKSAEGLIHPRFSQILQIRYLWWDDLVARLQASEISVGTATPHPTGFHGVNLGTTPRVNAPIGTSTYQRLASGTPCLNDRGL